MNYSGVARNSTEFKEALSLAAVTFSPWHSRMEDAISRKTFMLAEHPGFSERSSVVVCNEGGSVVGSAFLIDCTFPCGDKAMSGVFISSVSIAEQLRGKGLSVHLMKAAIDVASARGADIAVVIARRAVDGYYTRFGFWGISQYSKVALNVATLPPPAANRSAINLRQATPEDFKQCAVMYNETYKYLLGHCSRSLEMWSYINRKLAYLDLKFEMVRDGELVVAYVIHDGEGAIHEIAIRSIDTWCIRSLFAAVSTTTENVTMHIPPRHPFLSRLNGADVTSSLRECGFGGHMVRILNRNSVASVRGSTQNLLLMRNNHAILSLAETAALLRAARVTDFDLEKEKFSRDSFNIPYLDQI